MEEEPTGSKRKPPSCSRCSNHGKDAPLTHHKCPFEECDCLLCKLTWARKIVMRKQQQLWRQRKETQKWEEAAAEAIAGGGGGGEGEAEEGGGKQREKYCDMCRNHGVLIRNRGHKRSCKYENCPCDLCTFTRKRRQIMQLQQKVKRSKITTAQFEEATEWVAKLTAELASLGIDDVPMSTLVAPMAPSSNVPQHGHYPPPHQPPPPPPPTGPSPLQGLAEVSYPSNVPPELYQSAHAMEPYPHHHHHHQPPPHHQQVPPHQVSPSCSRMATRPFLPVAPVSAPEHYPSTSYSMDPSGSSASTSCAMAAGTGSGATSWMDPTSFASLCPPSPSYTSLSASPLSDYDPSYPGCPSPLMPYLSADNTGREMTSIPQQACGLISNAQPSEPLDRSSDHPIHSSRSHKHAHNRLPEHTENPSVHIKRPMYSSPQSSHPGWPADPRNMEEMTPETHWPGQRRRSEGVIQPTYQHFQRRKSDSILEGVIYLPNQRRYSDGVIKKCCVQNQRGNNDPVIQEGIMQEDRSPSKDEPQKHFKPDLRDNAEGVIEKHPETDSRIQAIHHLDRRRNSDTVLPPRYTLNERRNSDGVNLKYYALSHRGNFDRIIQKPVMYHLEKSEQDLYSGYRENYRRSSDEFSQESCGIDHRRNSIDYIHSNYSLTERRDSDDPPRVFYWPYQRSDSGETIPENRQDLRRDSEEDIESFPSNKEHFFEDTLRREHEEMLRLNRTVPMTDSSMTFGPFSSDRGSYYPIRPPPAVIEDRCQQASGIREDTAISRTEDSDTVMSWSSHQIHDEQHAHHPEDNDEEMEGPLDLTTRSSTRD